MTALSKPSKGQFVDVYDSKKDKLVKRKVQEVWEYTDAPGKYGASITYDNLPRTIKFSTAIFNYIME